MKKILAIILTTLMPLSAVAWQPSGPVTVIIGFGPGSGNETLFRKVDSVISQQPNAPKFILEFKPGANELIGSNTFAQAKNNGQTLFVPAIGAWLVSPIWYEKTMIQDPATWIPVISLGETPLALYASSASNVTTPDQFVNKLKSGDRVNIATGAGVHMLAYQYIIRATKAKDTQLIQYNSPASVANAVAANQVEFGITPLSLALELSKAGKLKIIGITGNNKVDNIPLLNKTIAGLNLVGQVGVMLPRDTSPEIVEYYRKLFQTAVATNEYQQFINELTWHDSLKTPEAYKRFISDETKKWSPVVKKIIFGQ
jgi:tripartite-type tricarboxylate transporter receptor subunit TctC